jgi:hypothetical protein
MSNTKKRLAFLCRSLLWSAMLYVFVMLVTNWDEVNNSVHGRGDVVITSLLQDANTDNGNSQKNISGKASLISMAESIIRVVMGITSKAGQ